MKTPAIILAVVVIGIIATLGFAFSGIYDVSASSSHSGLANWLLSTTSHASIERRARNIEVPDLDDDALVLAGVNDFDSMCAGCHGAPGRDPEAMGQGLNPPAPDLAEEAAELTPGELFWVTKNGIKMTGMPAWGATHGDDAIWPVVAFMTKLPGLDEAAYQELLASAAGQGHHAPDAGNVQHSHEEPAPLQPGVPLRPGRHPRLQDRRRCHVRSLAAQTFRVESGDRTAAMKMTLVR
jgi:mono/diheme cytochrome c family protein